MGVFGPLNSTWKAEVNKASAEWIPIQKADLLIYYSRACEKAFSENTLRSAFCKMGIFPFHHNVIEADPFAPPLNMTTQPAQPVPATLPDLLKPVTATTTPSS